MFTKPTYFSNNYFLSINVFVVDFDLKSKSYYPFSGTQNSDAAQSSPISIFPSCPEAWIASFNKVNESSSRVGGAKPPSSPTFVASIPYFFFMIFYKLWYTSAPPYNAYLKELKPVGRIMNSYIANRFPACLLLINNIPAINDI